MKEGGELRRRRRNRKLTIVEAAKRMGVCANLVAKIENGRYPSLLKRETDEALAKFYGNDVRHLWPPRRGSGWKRKVRS